MHLKMLSGKWRPFCLGLNVLSGIVEVWWCMYASVNLFTIGSFNGLAPAWCQALTWTNVDLLSVGAIGLLEIWIKFWLKYKHFWYFMTNKISLPFNVYQTESAPKRCTAMFIQLHDNHVHGIILFIFMNHDIYSKWYFLLPLVGPWNPGLSWQFVNHYHPLSGTLSRDRGNGTEITSKVMTKIWNIFHIT